MKIYSWNVNGLRAVLNKGALQNFLIAEQPDILCLQEIKAKPAQIEYDFLGYQIFYNSAERPGYSGTAILVKEGMMTKFRPLVFEEGQGWTFLRPLALTPLTAPRDADYLVTTDAKERVVRSVGRGPKESALLLSTTGPAAELPGATTFETSSVLSLALQEGRIQILDCGLFYLVNVYTPNSKPDLSRLKLRECDWDPSFLNLLQTLEKTKPIVTCGDFNAAHTEIDLARPKTNHKNAGFTNQERQGITNLINAGFVDTFRMLYPEVQRYTWWSHWGNARANNVGWRIDYFFISAVLRPHLKSAAIYEQYMGSDHCPISIDLEF